MKTQDFSITRALAGASSGGVLEAQIFPLAGVGGLRVTYNWLYSALNCDPSDSSPFTWTITKLVSSGGSSVIALMPKDGYGGRSVFASVRPDWSYYVQVQAPNSADWIVAVGSDETIVLGELGFLTVSLQGVNGQYVAVNTAISSHDDHSGYRLQSNSGAVDDQSSFFLAVTQNLQAGLDVPLIGDLSATDIEAACAARSVRDPAAVAATILAATR